MANRLAAETSPYLLQHAHNPVDWYPWGSEALDKAKAEQKPILVSIGYSACHWCHVMERESFEDDQVAAIMNQDFVNIKIDREERPDLDHIYMDAVQTLSGSGGWPLNVFLTPDAKPFYGGTYFPPTKAYNRSSWTDVLLAVAKAWQDKPQEILSQADNLTDHLRQAVLGGKKASQNPAELSSDLLRRAESALLSQADKQWGGFGAAPKFPQTFGIVFLLRQAYFGRQTTQHEGFAHALHSLDALLNGGIYDHLQGGFARYSTDAQWLAPHFEKMLYDNALLIMALSEAAQATGRSRYKQAIAQTLRFVQQEWQDADGGFFSAYDADSEGVEGKYYVWTKEEIEDILQDLTAAALFCDCYQVTPAGNWEHANILWTPEPLEAIFTQHGYTTEAGQAMLAKARNQLLVVRQQRPKPLLDDKKLMGWNALMISACCKAFAALGDTEYINMAIRAAACIEQCFKLTNGGYAHNYKAGKAANPAFLDDLAAYVQALCHLQECTGKLEYLDTAGQITERIFQEFLMEDEPFFYFTPAWQSDVIMRRKDLYDGAVPSGNSLMAQNLMYLGVVYDRVDWRSHAENMLAKMAPLVERYPSSFGNWGAALQNLVNGTDEIAVVGEQAINWGQQILTRWWPNKILQCAEGSSSRFPLLAQKTVPPAQTLIFRCKQYCCEQPVAAVEALQQWL